LLQSRLCTMDRAAGGAASDAACSIAQCGIVEAGSLTARAHVVYNDTAGAAGRGRCCDRSRGESARDIEGHYAPAGSPSAERAIGRDAHEEPVRAAGLTGIKDLGERGAL